MAKFYLRSFFKSSCAKLSTTRKNGVSEVFRFSKKPPKWSALNNPVFYFLWFGLILFSSLLSAQNVMQITDTSEKYSDQLFIKASNYKSQIEKEYVPEKYKVLYREMYKAGITELGAINDLRSDKKDIERILHFLDHQEPFVFANELSSWTINIGTGYLGKKFKMPVYGAIEKVFTENISAGIFFSGFTERFSSGKPYPETGLAYIDVYEKNYLYKCLATGIKGSYHFLTPASHLFNLNPENFDLYASVLAGVNIASKPNEILINDGDFVRPLKKGLNIGAFGGFRYMIDEYVGAYLEAGYSGMGFVNAGLTFKINSGMNKMKKKKAELERKKREEEERIRLEEEEKKRKEEEEKQRLEDEKNKKTGGKKKTTPGKPTPASKNKKSNKK